MRNIIVCMPLSVSGYKPTFEAEQMMCDDCKEDMWVPANSEDMPIIDGPGHSIEWLCCRCFTNNVVHNKLGDDDNVHLLIEEGDGEDRLFMLSQMELDQEVAWIEENLGSVCKVSNKIFPEQDDMNHRLLWQTVLIFVWEVLQRRKNGLIGDEKVFDRWSAEESKEIMKFILWKPKELNDGKDEESN